MRFVTEPSSPQKYCPPQKHCPPRKRESGIFTFFQSTFDILFKTITDRQSSIFTFFQKHEVLRYGSGGFFLFPLWRVK